MKQAVYQRSPGGIKNCPDSPQLLQKAAKCEHFLFPWKSTGTSSTFPQYRGHLIKLCNTRIEAGSLPWGWVGIIDNCSSCIVLLGSGWCRGQDQTPCKLGHWGEVAESDYQETQEFLVCPSSCCWFDWREEWALQEPYINLFMSKIGLGRFCFLATVWSVHFVHLSCITDQEVHLIFCISEFTSPRKHPSLINIHSSYICS